MTIGMIEEANCVQVCRGLIGPQFPYSVGVVRGGPLGGMGDDKGQLLELEQPWNDRWINYVDCSSATGELKLKAQGLGSLLSRI